MTQKQFNKVAKTFLLKNGFIPSKSESFTNEKYTLETDKNSFTLHLDNDNSSVISAYGKFKNHIEGVTYTYNLKHNFHAFNYKDVVTLFKQYIFNIINLIK